MDIIYLMTFTPEDAEPYGGFEGVAARAEALLETQEEHGMDIESVYEEDGKLVLTFESESDQNFFINEIYQ